MRAFLVVCLAVACWLACIGLVSGIGWGIHKLTEPKRQAVMMFDAAGRSVLDTTTAEPACGTDPGLPKCEVIK